MRLSLSALLVLFGAATPALAASDLSASMSGPSVDVYESGRYTVAVANIGNKDASNVSVAIQLPTTGTTPVYVMGTVDGKHSSCAQSGSTVTCTLGTLRKGRSTSVYVDLTLPESVDALNVSAWASTTSAENSTANNDADVTPALGNPDVTSFTGSGAVTNDHCTGTNLTSYYECTLFPSSISSHDAVLNGDGTVTFPGEPDYGGTWESDAADHLYFEYTYAGDVVATFEGYGVDADCWEGLTVFPDSAYVSMYRVCVP